MKRNGINDAIRNMYASTVTRNGSCGCSPDSVRADPGATRSASRAQGYSDGELDSIPGEANLGLGCGNPVALAVIRKGDVVLDLGSGAGVDCFLASNEVGPEGRVIGVDMTPEMVERATVNASSNGYRNVEFRLGEIENLPVESSSVDVVISNCVINLSTDKPRVFQEASRVLKPGGKLLVSDIVLLEELPGYVRDSIDAYVMCISGAIRKEEYLEAIEQAGFGEVTVVGESRFPAELVLAQPHLMDAVEKMKIPMGELERLAGNVVSMKVSAKKVGFAADAATR
jgi:SAM-dependent methyltransferase